MASTKVTEIFKSVVKGIYPVYPKWLFYWRFALEE